MDFLSIYGILCLRNFLLGLLGWREKRGFASPLSQSLLGRPLDPRNEKGRELVLGLKTFPNQEPRHPKLPEEAGRQGHQFREKKGRRDERTAIKGELGRNYCYSEGCKVLGLLSLGHKKR